jgi:hypothetical protein
MLATLLTMVALSANAATKDIGTTVLKDVQPAGTTDKKNKHQQYDLYFTSAAAGKDYTCRTSAKTSVKATDLVVGSNVTYQVNGNKGKVKTSAGKQLDCTIVRVADTSAAPK